MAILISALLMGALFGAGLLISGMTDPANVKGFLNVGSIGGPWRPQLMAVLGAGVVVTWAIYAIARRRSKPLVTAAFEWPSASQIDRPLLTGAALFGAGWALAGYCPGPALVALGALSPAAIAFVAAMAAGNVAHRFAARIGKAGD